MICKNCKEYFKTKTLRIDGILFQRCPNCKTFNDNKIKKNRFLDRNEQNKIASKLYYKRGFKDV